MKTYLLIILSLLLSLSVTNVYAVNSTTLVSQEVSLDQTDPENEENDNKRLFNRLLIASLGGFVLGVIAMVIGAGSPEDLGLLGLGGFIVTGISAVAGIVSIVSIIVIGNRKKKKQ